MELARFCISILIGYLIAYSLIDRICKCVENCFATKSLGEILQSDEIDLDDLFSDKDD